MSNSTIQTRDGATLAYQLHGEGTATRRLVLIHSLAMSGAFWDEVRPHLPGDLQVLTYDCRGHGQSDKPAGPYRVEQFADDLADLLDALGWQKAVVAGCSMGGCVALAFAHRHAARLAGLTLIDTTAWYGPEAPQQWAERGTKGRTEGLASLLGFQRTRWFTEGFLQSAPDRIARLEEIFLANDPEAYAETCNMLGACDMRAALAGIGVPVAVVVGEEDYATPPAMARAMHEAIPGSTLTVLPKVRHFSPIEAPGQIAAAIAGLLDRVGG